MDRATGTDPLDSRLFELGTVFSSILDAAMNPVVYPVPAKRLLEQVREVLRYKHYSLKTEQAYVYWVRFFVRWHGRGAPMRHPRDRTYLNFCVRGAERLVHGDGRRLRRTTDAVGKSVPHLKRQPS